MKMSNYSSKNVLFSSDKEYFYIEKIRNNEQEINFNRSSFGIIAIILGAFMPALKSTTTRTTNYFWNRSTLSNVPCFVLILIALLNDLWKAKKAIYYLVVFVSFYFLCPFIYWLQTFDFLWFQSNRFCNSYRWAPTYSGLAYYFSTFEEKTTK
jgi:hypothetical protein